MIDEGSEDGSIGSSEKSTVVDSKDSPDDMGDYEDVETHKEKKTIEELRDQVWELQITLETQEAG